MAVPRRPTRGPVRTPDARPVSRPVTPAAGPHPGAPQRPSAATPPPVEIQEVAAPVQAPEPAPAVSAPAPQAARRSTGRARPGTGRGAPVGGNDAGGDSGESQRKGGQIGALSRRGFTLNQKFVLLALLVSLPITVLFGMVAVSDLEKQLLDEIKRSGYQQALVLNGFGRHVVARFKGAPNQLDFDNILTKYKAGGEGDTAYKDDREYIKRMVAGDKRIKDVAIFASAGSVSDPNVPVLRGDDSAKTITTPPSRSLAVNVAEPDPDIFIYWGDYGGENCLYFRVPLVKGSGTDQSGRPLLHSMGMVIMSAGEIDRQVASLRNQLVLFGLLLVGAGVGLALGLAGRITRPINALVDDINIVAKGDLDYESDVPNQTSDEVGLLAGAFNRMTRNLRDARDNERDRERIESELNSAKAIHARLLPEKIPQLPGIDIGTAYNSAKEVGGDYYDFIPVGDIEHLALCVADVSGKGIPGSMVMGTTRTILRMMAVNNLSAMDVLSKTNYHVARDIKRGMFVTCMYAILNVRTKEMTVASAGHNPMLIWRAATRTIEKVRPNGIALGFDKGPVFNRTIREQKVPLQPGDRVVLYTDGVVESMNAQREEWGDEALDELTLKYATQSSKEYVRLLVKALEEHQGQAEQHDDITIMTFRIS